MAMPAGGVIPKSVPLVELINTRTITMIQQVPAPPAPVIMPTYSRGRVVNA
jgi:hypothetical protein